jgi:hypothetical protein
VNNIGFLSDFGEKPSDRWYLGGEEQLKLGMVASRILSADLSEVD